MKWLDKIIPRMCYCKVCNRFLIGFGELICDECNKVN